MDLARKILENRRALLDDLDRRIEDALKPFARALDCFLATLFQARLPADWRQQWHAFVAEQAAKEFFVNPQSVRELEEWIEAWARFCGLLPLEESRIEDAQSKANASSDESKNPTKYPSVPGAALLPSIGESEGPEPTVVAPENPAPPLPAGRGDQTEFGTGAEDIVSEEVGIPRNPQGPGQQTIPGSGKRKIRIPDLLVRGPDGSLYLRGTVVEVKASGKTKFGNLSGPSRKQIEDAVKYVTRLREKAGIVKDPRLRALLEHARVEVFSDLDKPTVGKFAEFIEQQLLEWKPIPRVPNVVPYVPTSIGKPRLGLAENIALGLVISLAEAGVANAVYRESVAVLTDLLKLIAKNGDADESGWQEIEAKVRKIGDMQQSWLGLAWEVLTYGQGSLQEKQAIAMMMLASDLADRYGYVNKKSWSDLLTGGQGHFEKEQ